MREPRQEGIYKAFMLQVKRLLLENNINIFLLEDCTNHLIKSISQLINKTIPVPKIFIYDSDDIDLGSTRLQGNYLGYRNVIKIKSYLLNEDNKIELIRTFIHELYHYIQIQIPDLFMNSFRKGGIDKIEKDTSRFVNKVLEQAIKL
jgi:hypothetical protein